MTIIALRIAGRRVVPSSQNVIIGRSFGSKSSNEDEPLILTSLSENGIYTVQMNRPKQLNAWTQPMMFAIRDEFKQASNNEQVKVVILTGRGKYYCAGVNLSSLLMKPMPPAKLHSTIRQLNQALFEMFLDFPKPIICAMNGPAIGASVTSATLCDAIVASSTATLSTPFARLGLPPEGCSSVHFPQIMGDFNAQRMLGGEGWAPTAAEAKDIGLVYSVVENDNEEHSNLLATSQDLASQWISENKPRSIGPKNANLTKLAKVNSNESIDLADAFLSEKFLERQATFLKSKNKTGPALALSALRYLRPIWGRFLPPPGHGKM